MCIYPENATTVTLAFLALHNFLLSKQDGVFASPTLVDREDAVSHKIMPGDWRQAQQSCFRDLPRQTGNRNAADAQWVRNELKENVNHEGQVSWQERLVFGRVMS